MANLEFEHGFSDVDWEAAKGQARAIMIEYARRQRTIWYSQIAPKITAIRVEPHDPRLFHLLGKVAEGEDNAGRGLLSAVVVHKDGEQMPGPGFFDLARSRGRNAQSNEQIWISELHRVFAIWKNHPETQHVPRTGLEYESLPIVIPEWSGASHPFSRGQPKFYRPQDLRDNAEGDTARTQFFETRLLGIFWAIGRPVPYAFLTKNGELRSLDAGCLKFLRNRREPRIEFVTGPDEIILAVLPTPRLISTYEQMRPRLVTEVSGSEPPLEIPFDLDAPVDERRKIQSEVVIREGAAEFRKHILAIWGGRCAVTRTRIESVLDAAHIHRYLGLKTNDLRNGVLLRADIHRLFDDYLLTITRGDDTAKIRVSMALNGSMYTKLDSQSFMLPKRVDIQPDQRILEHHNKKFFEAEENRR